MKHVNGNYNPITEQERDVTTKFYVIITSHHNKF